MLWCKSWADQERFSRVWHDREDVRDAYDHQKAKVRPSSPVDVIAANPCLQLFTCGSGKVSQGVKKVLTDIIKEAKGFTDEEAAAAFERAIQGRYATDIFE